MILAAYEYRLLTSEMFEALFFAALRHPSGNGTRRNPRCQRRLQLLFHHGYLFRDEQVQRPSEPRKPMVYALDLRGAELIAEMQGNEPENLTWRPKHNRVSPWFQGHALACSAFRVAVTLATRRLGYRITQWLDDRSLRSQQMQQVVTVRGPEGGELRIAIVPDAYFVIETPERSFCFFLEMDLGTETTAYTSWERRDFRRKILGYLEFINGGRYQQAFGVSGVRVLTVTTGLRRLTHLKRVAEAVGARNRYWFTTLDQIQPNDSTHVLTDRIWEIATRDGRHSLFETN